jgi:hypothetical protein
MEKRIVPACCVTASLCIGPVRSHRHHFVEVAAAHNEKMRILPKK